MQGAQTSRVPRERVIVSSVGLLFSISLFAGCSLSPGLAVNVPNVKDVADKVPMTATLITPALVASLRAQRERASTPTATGDLESERPYLIGAGDRLHIAVWGHPDLATGVSGNIPLPQFGATISSGPAGAGNMAAAGVSASPLNGNAPDRAVDEDGTLFMPLAGKVRAAGKSVAELRDELQVALKPYIHEPQVEVQVTGYFSQKVFVAGQVRNPGAVPITSIPLKVTDGLAQTGGALQDSNLTVVKLTRRGQTRTLDLDRLYYEGRQGDNVQLQDGDVLTVPDRTAEKIYVLGEVTAPKSYPLHRGGVTLAEALADAGGPNSVAASTAQIYVLRLDENAQPVVYQLDGRRPESLVLSQEFPVQRGDVVVVNPTVISRVSRLVNQFFPLLSETALVRSLR